MTNSERFDFHNYRNTAEGLELSESVGGKVRDLLFPRAGVTTNRDAAIGDIFNTLTGGGLDGLAAHDFVLNEIERQSGSELINLPNVPHLMSRSYEVFVPKELQNKLEGANGFMYNGVKLALYAAGMNGTLSQAQSEIGSSLVTAFSDTANNFDYTDNSQMGFVERMFADPVHSNASRFGSPLTTTSQNQEVLSDFLYNEEFLTKSEINDYYTSMGLDPYYAETDAGALKAIARFGKAVIDGGINTLKEVNFEYKKYLGGEIAQNVIKAGIQSSSLGYLSTGGFQIPIAFFLYDIIKKASDALSPKDGQEFRDFIAEDRLLGFIDGAGDRELTEKDFTILSGEMPAPIEGAANILDLAANPMKIVENLYENVIGKIPVVGDVLANTFGVFGAQNKSNPTPAEIAAQNELITQAGYNQLAEDVLNATPEQLQEYLDRTSQYPETYEELVNEIDNYYDEQFPEQVNDQGLPTRVNANNTNSAPLFNADGTPIQTQNDIDRGLQGIQNAGDDLINSGNNLFPGDPVDITGGGGDSDTRLPTYNDLMSNSGGGYGAQGEPQLNEDGSYYNPFESDDERNARLEAESMADAQAGADAQNANGDWNNGGEGVSQAWLDSMGIDLTPAEWAEMEAENAAAAAADFGSNIVDDGSGPRNEDGTPYNPFESPEERAARLEAEGMAQALRDYNPDGNGDYGETRPDGMLPGESLDDYYLRTYRQGEDEEYYGDYYGPVGPGLNDDDTWTPAYGTEYSEETPNEITMYDSNGEPYTAYANADGVRAQAGYEQGGTFDENGNYTEPNYNGGVTNTQSNEPGSGFTNNPGPTETELRQQDNRDSSTNASNSDVANARRAREAAEDAQNNNNNSGGGGGGMNATSTGGGGGATTGTNTSIIGTDTNNTENNTVGTNTSITGTGTNNTENNTVGTNNNTETQVMTLEQIEAQNAAVLKAYEAGQQAAVDSSMQSINKNGYPTAAGAETENAKQANLDGIPYLSNRQEDQFGTFYDAVNDRFISIDPPKTKETNVTKESPDVADTPEPTIADSASGLVGVGTPLGPGALNPGIVGPGVALGPNITDLDPSSRTIDDGTLVGTETAVTETGTAVAGTDTAVAGTDTAVAGTDTAVAGTDTAVTGTDTAVTGTDTAVTGTGTAATGEPSYNVEDLNLPGQFTEGGAGGIPAGEVGYGESYDPIFGLLEVLYGSEVANRYRGGGLAQVDAQYLIDNYQRQIEGLAFDRTATLAGQEQGLVNDLREIQRGNDLGLLQNYGPEYAGALYNTDPIATNQLAQQNAMSNRLYGEAEGNFSDSRQAQITEDAFQTSALQGRERDPSMLYERLIGSEQARADREARAQVAGGNTFNMSRNFTQQIPNMLLGAGSSPYERGVGTISPPYGTVDAAGAALQNYQNNQNFMDNARAQAAYTASIRQAQATGDLSLVEKIQNGFNEFTSGVATAGVFFDTLNGFGGAISDIADGLRGSNIPGAGAIAGVADAVAGVATGVGGIGNGAIGSVTDVLNPSNTQAVAQPTNTQTVAQPTNTQTVAQPTNAQVAATNTQAVAQPINTQTASTFGNTAGFGQGTFESINAGINVADTLLGVGNADNPFATNTYGESTASANQDGFYNTDYTQAQQTNNSNPIINGADTLLGGAIDLTQGVVGTGADIATEIYDTGTTVVNTAMDVAKGTADAIAELWGFIGSWND